MRSGSAEAEIGKSNIVMKNSNLRARIEQCRRDEKLSLPLRRGKARIEARSMPCRPAFTPTRALSRRGGEKKRASALIGTHLILEASRSLAIIRCPNL